MVDALQRQDCTTDVPPPLRADALWAALATWFRAYPGGVCPVPEPIRGTAFFPGGYGLWREGDPDRIGVPHDGVMVVGQDFHSEAGYRKWRALGSEWPHVATWRGLRPVLEGAGISLEQCFFTNAYMGLRTGAKATGVFPGIADRTFTHRCHEFLLHQIALIHPRLIVTLGKPAFQALGAIAKGLEEWRVAQSFRELDRAGPVCVGQFADNRKAVVAALLHPSLRSASLKHRTWLGRRGNEAEASLLEAATKLAGLSR